MFFQYFFCFLCKFVQCCYLFYIFYIVKVFYRLVLFVYMINVMCWNVIVEYEHILNFSVYTIFRFSVLWNLIKKINCYRIVTIAIYKMHLNKKYYLNTLITIIQYIFLKYNLCKKIVFFEWNLFIKNSGIQPAGHALLSLGINKKSPCLG